MTQTDLYTFWDVEHTQVYTCSNHNSFLQMMDGALSGKTGFTSKAGYCYVGALERDGKCLIVALLACGWPNNRSYKWTDTRLLMEYGLENYQYPGRFSSRLDARGGGGVLRDSTRGSWARRLPVCR